MTTVSNFLKQVKAKCEVKAKQMAQLELSVWDEDHETQIEKRIWFY